ncbi:hypothetical protein [Neisseria sp.]|uniref:hypothetical protein n=1 Tax=Neisseria sp. TaxID=192066 RepID=UPI0026DAA333|nr:hypothetical protein [Neisseria sp.]MDO4227166.1 hypothetical protein [Neisseria sp.]
MDTSAIENPPNLGEILNNGQIIAVSLQKLHATTKIGRLNNLPPKTGSSGGGMLRRRAVFVQNPLQ